MHPYRLLIPLMAVKKCIKIIERSTSQQQHVCWPDKKMNITSTRIVPVDKGLWKASASIVLNNQFILRDISIVERASGGLAVIMPNRSKPDGTKHAYFRPLDNATREEMTALILKDYELLNGNPNEIIVWHDKEMAEPISVTNIRVAPIENDPVVQAIVSVTLDNAIVLNQVRIIKDPDDNRVWLSMPAKKVVYTGDDGERKEKKVPYFHPMSPECRRMLTQDVLRMYQVYLQATA